MVDTTSGGDSTAWLSPDDRWLLYASTSGGRREVYVQPFRAHASATRVSSSGGSAPFWSRTASEIVFQHDDHLVAVSFRAEGDHAAIGNETALFALPAWSVLYGVAPDGRFLVGRPTEPAPAPGLRVVLNWFEELRKLAPVK